MTRTRPSGKQARGVIGTGVYEPGLQFFESALGRIKEAGGVEHISTVFARAA